VVVKSDFKVFLRGPIKLMRRRDWKMTEISALIVDDSSVMRKIVERALRQAGVAFAKVFEASNGVEWMFCVSIRLS
jgi:PleD family two-component response regulator